MANIKEYIRAVVNSSRRLNPLTETTSSFTFSFNKAIPRISEIIIESIQIPFSFYVINATNNVLTFNNGTIVVTMPIGNYTSTSLSITLKPLIDTAFGDTTTTVSFSFNTFKLTIARGTAFIVDSLLIVPASTLSNILGFVVSSISGISATGANAINISGPNYISILSNALTKPVNHKTAFADASYSNVLATIPVNVSPGNMITSYFTIQEPLKYSYKYAITPKTVIDFTIVDEFNNVLNLNGLDIGIQMYFITI